MNITGLTLNRYYVYSYPTFRSGVLAPFPLKNYRSEGMYNSCDGPLADGQNKVSSYDSSPGLT